MKTKTLKLIFSILLCQSIGLLGSVFTTSSVKTWYPTLQKPPFTPPNWIFAPVWTLLFLLMGISLYLVLIKKPDKKTNLGITFFGIQLTLNFFWSFLFFYLKGPFLGFLEIIFLWISIILTIIQFWRIDKKASYLLIPYLVWVTFAGILNFFLWRLNL